MSAARFNKLRERLDALYSEGGISDDDGEAVLARIAAAEASGERAPRWSDLVQSSARPSEKEGRARGYIEHYNPQRKTRILLEAVDRVLAEYRAHWPLTIRQIYYSLVGAHNYPKTTKFYGTLIHHLGQARRGRRIPFHAIRDDGVTTVPFDHYADADAFRAMMRAKAARFERDKMARQDLHVEVWCEAAGMIVQLAEVAEQYSIPVYSSSGFDSLTAKYDLAKRICRVGRKALILHLGDFDPSGEAVFNSIAEDVAKFVRRDRPHGLVKVEFRRVALTAEQVEKFDLPTAPVKETDSRAKSWDGETCQLEALPPDKISLLLDAAICEAVDLDQLEADRDLSEQERDELTRGLIAYSTAGRNSDGARP